MLTMEQNVSFTANQKRVIWSKQFAKLLENELAAYHGADFEVSGVEWVSPVPSLGSELPPLGDDSVEVTEGEQDALELCLLRAHLHRVLKQLTNCLNI